ncbi:hypothetical protein [Kitasatospora sp. NPDC058218]|uniref:hypothetical protein n=1 Tax=Kitasatospora sp. NPDC058218 TaxID=3346385 RepID=UPI0036DBA545
MKRTGTRGQLAVLAALLAAGTLTQTGTAHAQPRATDQCGGNVADYTYPARPFQFDDVVSKWNGVQSVLFNDDMTLTVTANDPAAATTSGKWELHDPNGPNPAKVGVVTFYTSVSPAVTGDGVATIYHYVGHPVCNPTAADPAKKLFQIVGDVQLQPVYADNSFGPLSVINGFSADR